MATTKLGGTGVITSADFKNVKWVGVSKGGKAVTITLKDAINMGNIDWTFAEKNDTVAQLVFTATYSNTDSTSASTAEPWELETEETGTGAAGIVLGSGIFYVGENAIALSRGGGQFQVQREYREINADGDRGPVKDRIVMDGSRATLTMNALTFLASVQELYPAVAVRT